VDGARRPLVICYGNRLRSDDGVAWQVADRLTGDVGLAGVDVICRHQLTPELAEDVSRARRVIFVDAAAGGTPGTVRHAALVAPAGDVNFAAWSHDLTPARLAGLAVTIFGRVPPLDVVTVAAGSFAVGEDLSAPVAAAVEAAAGAVAGLAAAGPGVTIGRAPRADQP